jgi:hypothetical protein
MDYFEINRISNSDLSHFKSEVILDQTYRLPEKATNFGKAFHALLLEPQVATRHYPTVDYNLINRLVEKVRNEILCRGYLEGGVKEEVILFTDPTTQAKCKAKLDIIFENNQSKEKTIIDFKTTCAKDYAHFISSLVAYDYDRQAAFYTDSINAQSFILIGVQKIKPYEMFYFEASKLPDFVEYGRKKYKALLKGYIDYYNLAANNYYKVAS